MFEFSLKQISNKIWHLNFSSSYDLTIHFFRYHSCNDIDIKASNIQFVDLMENYSRKMGKGIFTYTKDWAGFNIPGDEIFKKHSSGISDPNRYDELMYSLASYIRAKESSEKFYIIGTSEEDPWKNITFNHELAHGLFYADDVYKDKITKYVEKLPIKVKNKIFTILKKWGYSDDMLIDETQAYLSTGLQSELDIPLIQEYQARFKRLFNLHSKGIRKSPEKGLQVIRKAASKKAKKKSAKKA